MNWNINPTKLNALDRSPLFQLRSFLLVFSVCVLCLAAKGQTPVKMDHPMTSVSSGEAQKIFDKMKTLSGTWLGSLTTSPAVPGMEGKLAQIVLRVTSKGNAMLHEMTVAGEPDDPITMFYLDGDKLLLTHYCDAGNRPRMEGKISADGKTLEFNIVDLAGGERHGHMSHAVFTIIDADHHTEDWTLMITGVNKPLKAHFDLQRSR
jgi:hypothetical protein